MPKTIDAFNKRVREGRTPMFSFEYFPPKTDKGVENLYERLDRMAILDPLWIDVTWGAGGSTSALTLEICSTAQNYIGLETMMHMTCTNMPKEELKASLEKARASGLQNILALRGDPPRGESWKQIEGGFAHAVDLVKFIREEYGDYFGITVAGYPEAHVDSVSYDEDLKHLKEKVDAGADMIITQLFYDTGLFLKFVNDCRKLGITCPIIPGIMPIHTYGGFIRMTTLCKTFVPPSILEALEPIKNDDEAVKGYGVKLGIEMCRTLLAAGVPALHFYTLNLEKSVTQILEGLGLVEEGKRRPLPFTQVGHRAKEEVRPVFWSHRPRSYIQRTLSWDEFPNGRWGDSRSPAFGDLTDYHLGSLHAVKSGEVKRLWGEPKNVQDIYDVFAKYCAGEVEQLPWIDRSLSPESDSIKPMLIKLNKNGFLTINSQPAVNGVSSTDDIFGWGPGNGYIYQKAYLEFFTSAENLQRLVAAVKKFPSMTYHATNRKGDSLANTGDHSVSAITWGVFPGKEILQPTVVDSDSFMVWKDEAFVLWDSQWAAHYDEGSESRKILQSVIDTYYLVNVVDNNYINGNIFALFEYLISGENSTSKSS